MAWNTYNEQIEIIENIEYIKLNFWRLIDNYLTSIKWTLESNLYLNWIKWKASKLNNSQYKTLTEFVNIKIEQNSWDDKLQLLELWATLSNNEIKEQKEELTPFEISGYMKIHSFSINIWKNLHTKIGTKNKIYQITDSKINSIWDNKYSVSIKRENSSKEYSFIIQYKWLNIVNLYDKNNHFISTHKIEKQNIKVKEWQKYKRWFYIETYDKPSELKINIDDMDIYLDIIFPIK